MKPTTTSLYHYVHCPFCVRVRLALGFLNQEYASFVVPYDDEITPVKLTGKKMLPIIEYQGKIINESLDIISLIDVDKKIPGFLDKDFESLLNKIGNEVHSLAMPYWIWTPEFNESSRRYFQTKKEEKRGPFKNLVKNRQVYIDALEKIWPEIEANLNSYFQSEHLTIRDIALAAHLWGLYVVPEYRFPEKIHQYLQRVKTTCHFDYHADFWK